ncbi:hypothetical protein PanWU01x14_096400 [Parasponia andersonii]|uniref:Transmembrane protein n=1 Tax=Parasponia andersonii TaxID=3476 RepID=A0A2P5D4T9_PARAD|nr:hypothetical protein PanWU01x14_096400 [Parasponia andersonii]
MNFVRKFLAVVLITFYTYFIILYGGFAYAVATNNSIVQKLFSLHYGTLICCSVGSVSLHLLHGYSAKSLLLSKKVSTGRGRLMHLLKLGSMKSTSWLRSAQPGSYELYKYLFRSKTKRLKLQKIGM